MRQGNVDMAEGAFDMSAMQVSIDGQAVDNLSAYRAATPLFTLWLPPDNLLDRPSRPRMPLPMATRSWWRRSPKASTP